MFYYRPWASLPTDEVSKSKSSYGFTHPFRHVSAGYSSLLALTLLFSLTLNALFLFSLLRRIRVRQCVPDVLLTLFALRDVIVALFCLPTALAWLVTFEGSWNSGFLWCKVSGFLDLTLNMEYSLLLISFVIILLTAHFPSQTPVLENTLSLNYENSKIENFNSHSSFPYTTPLESQRFDGQKLSRASSPMTLSHLETPSSSSIIPSLSRLPSRPHPQSSSLSSYSSSSFPASRLLLEKQSLRRNSKLRPYPTFPFWHYVLLGVSIGLSVSLGAVGSLYIIHFPGHKPGCFIHAEPYSEEQRYSSTTIIDPATNFLLANVVLTYIVTLVLSTLSLFLLFRFRRKTKNEKLTTYIKVLFCFLLVFLLSRSPVDVLQLQSLFEAFKGIKKLSVSSYELEHEIVLVWSTYLPLLLNPIIVISLLSEYRLHSTLRLTEMSDIL